MRRQFLDLLCNGGDFSALPSLERPQLTSDVAIFSGEIRVDREPAFIRDNFRLLADFGQQKFCDFQRRFSPRFEIRSEILDDTK